MTSWKYKAGLGLIGAFVIIWVASAEVTQRIFEEYEQPFAITYVGVSLMAIFLPISVCKDWIFRAVKKCSYKKLHDRNLFLESPAGLYIPLRMNEVNHNPMEALKIYPLTGMDLNAAEEGSTFTSDGHEDGFPALEKSHDLSSLQIIKYSFYLAPVWFITEYLSNSALANTSVASTTVLTSTSGLFTLFFGALICQDTINVSKVAAVVISMTGVAMTTTGKTWALDEKLNISETRRHTITGDIFGLLSAVSYGLFTVLLKKFNGSERDKVHVEKFFGYIGLFSLIGLWWFIWPLNALGIEPQFKFPNSARIREALFINGIVGSVVSDFLWALSVVWTTPLVATIGMSLTIPLAMIADILIHGRHFSAMYILGCFQVFAGFVIANLSDK